MTPARMLAALLVLGLAAAPASAGATKKPPPPVKKSATYAGVSNQGAVCRVDGSEPRPCRVAFTTSKDRKRVTELVVSWRAPCKDDPARFYRSTTRATNVPISSARFSRTASYLDSSFGDGTSADNDFKLSGKFKRSSKGRYTVSGSFTVVSDLFLPGGAQTRCETGKVTFSAKP